MSSTPPGRPSFRLGLSGGARGMGSFKNHPLCTAVASLIAAAICLLNLSLVVQTLG